MPSLRTSIARVSVTIVRVPISPVENAAASMMKPRPSSTTAKRISKKEKAPGCSNRSRSSGESMVIVVPQHIGQPIARQTDDTTRAEIVRI